MSQVVKRIALVNPLPFLPRLEQHYEKVLYDDFMTLLYTHDSSFKKIETSLAQNPFKAPLSLLPTNPQEDTITGILHKPIIRQKVGFRRRVTNPIDYTSVPNSILMAPPKPAPALPFSPALARMPRLLSVTLRIETLDAVASKSVLLGAIMSLQSISGARPEPVFATKGDALKKVRVGMPIGCQVTITGADAYHFLDKTVQCVLPRLREYEGVNPIGDGKGSISFILPSASIGIYPDIEAHFDSFPRLYDTSVQINTTGVSDLETCLLLSGFGFPLMKEKVEELVVHVESSDPFARIKEAKTREERKALFADMKVKKKS